MHTIQTDRLTITMPNVNFGQPIEQAPHTLLVLTSDDLIEESKHKALAEDVSLYDDFAVTHRPKHTADVILYFRPDGKIKIFKNRHGIDGNLY